MNQVGISNNPHNASFSSYLDANERDFVRSLSESIHSSLSSTRDRLSIERRTRVPRSELCVFGAEKYFNEKVVNNNNNNNNTKMKSTMIPKEGVSTPNNKQRHRREKRDHFERKTSTQSTTSSTLTSSLKSPTPSLKSQVSWNSQFGLFLPKKASCSLRVFSSFQCKGSCFDRKSVYTVSTHQKVQKSSRDRSRPIPRVSQNEHFAFPIIDTASPYHYNKTQIPFYNIDQTRKPNDVFANNHQVKKQEIEHNLERKLSILAWDAIPNSTSPTLMPLPFPFSNTKKDFSTNDDDLDVRSECSSDLFEIENLVGIEKESTINNSTCMTPVTHFDAPSEASIEWSVITSSAAGFSIVNAESAKVMKNSSTSGLAYGCRNHKGVDVKNKYCHVSNAYRRSNEMIMGSKCDLKGNLNIAPSTPSRRSSIVVGTSMKNYAIAYA